MTDRDCTAYGVVYLITNNVNGKRYVGQTTKTIEHRFKQHKALKGACRAIESAIQKHGAENFKIEVLAAAGNQKELNETETRLICELGTVSPNGYNLQSGGGQTGAVHEETKRIQREKALNPERMAIFDAMRKSPDVLEKQRANGKRLASVSVPKMRAGITSESYKKVSAALKAHWSIPENLEKLIASKVGMYDRHPGLRDKRRQTFKGFWDSLSDQERFDYGRKLSKSLLGHKKKIDYSPEAKAHRKEIAKKRFANPEYAAKMKAVHADPENTKNRGDAIEKGWAERRKLVAEKNGHQVGSKGCYFKKSKSADRPGRWQVQIRKNGKSLQFGSFTNLEDAKAAYENAISSLS